jgi:hypothetical protein
MSRQTDAAANAAIYTRRGTFAVGIASSTTRWPRHERGMLGRWMPGPEIRW